jgi:hypothetical protein
MMAGTNVRRRDDSGSGSWASRSMVEVEELS